MIICSSLWPSHGRQTSSIKGRRFWALPFPSQYLQSKLPLIMSTACNCRTKYSALTSLFVSTKFNTSQACYPCGCSIDSYGWVVSRMEREVVWRWGLGRYGDDEIVCYTRRLLRHDFSTLALDLFWSPNSRGLSLQPEFLGQTRPFLRAVLSEHLRIGVGSHSGLQRIRESV